ncbi:MAG TPA: GAF domain-containing protein [Steroidobacteraceae bacterium]|nr:GAF domain-containing protein [Steroidobacteraceae bacterium]
MAQVSHSTPGSSKQDQYQEIRTALRALLEGERDGLAHCANTAALLYERLADLNWVGFYFARSNTDLVLGPFQGKVACVRIPWGRGVCGTAAERRTTLVVPDVHEFPGHIACDAASRSEIVVPLLSAGRVLGVLDLDSPRAARFDEVDAHGLNAIAELLVAHSDLGRYVDPL